MLGEPGAPSPWRAGATGLPLLCRRVLAKPPRGRPPIPAGSAACSPRGCPGPPRAAGTPAPGRGTPPVPGMGKDAAGCRLPPPPFPLPGRPPPPRAPSPVLLPPAPGLPRRHCMSRRVCDRAWRSRRRGRARKWKVILALNRIFLKLKLFEIQRPVSAGRGRAAGGRFAAGGSGGKSRAAPGPPAPPALRPRPPWEGRARAGPGPVLHNRARRPLGRCPALSGNGRGGGGGARHRAPGAAEPAAGPLPGPVAGGGTSPARVEEPGTAPPPFATALSSGAPPGPAAQFSGGRLLRSAALRGGSGSRSPPAPGGALPAARRLAELLGSAGRGRGGPGRRRPPRDGESVGTAPANGPRLPARDIWGMACT